MVADQTIHCFTALAIILSTSWFFGCYLALRREIKNRPQATKGQVPPGLRIGGWFYLLRGWYGRDGSKMMSVADAWIFAFYLSILQGLGGRYWFPLFGNADDIVKQRWAAWEMHWAIHSVWNMIGFWAAIKSQYPITEKTKMSWKTDDGAEDVTVREVQLPWSHNQPSKTWKCGYSKTLDTFYEILHAEVVFTGILGDPLDPE